MLDISFSYALFWEDEFYVTFFFFFRLFKQTVSVFSVEVSGKEIVDSYAYLVIFIECNMILFWVHCWWYDQSTPYEHSTKLSEFGLS